jgi:hypothetical protein
MTTVDATLELDEPNALLDEVRLQLPLWLQRAAQPQPEATDQLVDLLGFTKASLNRVRAVHALLSPAVSQLVDALPAAMRSPRPATERPLELSGVVRGPVDWAATARLHATGQSATFVVSPRRRVFDTPEHRALAWTLARLEDLSRIALAADDDDDDDDEASDPASWVAVAERVRRIVRWARRVEWLSGLRPDRPDRRTRARLARSRSRFTAGPLSGALTVLLAYDTQDETQLAAILAQIYFTPERDWRLFEVVVLIRLDKALADAADGVRRKLMSDSGQVGTYTLSDGDEIRLRYQGWSPGGLSRRQATAKRHGITVSASRPDIIVQRVGNAADSVVLELKASRRPDTLGDGLSQLLGYLYERPTLFAAQPSGWLVPLDEAVAGPTKPDPTEPLWIVPADAIAAAVIDRFAEVAESGDTDHIDVTPEATGACPS